MQALERAGARPLLIPPSEDGVEETLDAVDGLLFSGGSDVDPDLYDQQSHAETVGVVPERDRSRARVAQGALARDMPVLAVCRGSQVLNVARGGDLVQHLPDVVGDDKHKHTPGTFADHDVTLEQGTRLASLLGDRAPVKSHHHQGFGQLGDGLRIAAHAEDGTIEAVEDPTRRFTLGVLWHPEAGEDLRSVRGARARRARVRGEPASGSDPSASDRSRTSRPDPCARAQRRPHGSRCSSRPSRCRSPSIRSISSASGARSCTNSMAKSAASRKFGLSQRLTRSWKPCLKVTL